MKTNSQVVRLFILTAGAVLLGLALAMMLANVSRLGLTRPRDPVLEIPMSTMFWGLAGFELVLAWFCLFTKDVFLRVSGILWLSAILAGYWLAFRIDGNPANFCLYVTSMADAFAVRPGSAYTALKVLNLYLFIGSLCCLLWLWREHFGGRDHVRETCNYCGGHIEFSAANLGQTIPCPHCQKTITLRKSENLKISCYFCKGHIEFPAHAIGQKLKCPHCKMDLTLKEPA